MPPADATIAPQSINQDDVTTVGRVQFNSEGLICMDKDYNNLT